MKRKKQSKEEKAPKKERKEKDYKLIKKSIESFLCICHSDEFKPMKKSGEGILLYDVGRF